MKRPWKHTELFADRFVDVQHARKFVAAVADDLVRGFDSIKGSELISEAEAFVAKKLREASDGWRSLG